jgi:hypothetical protein
MSMVPPGFTLPSGKIIILSSFRSLQVFLGFAPGTPHFFLGSGAYSPSLTGLLLGIYA